VSRRRAALFHLPNWLQLGRFVAVGLSGFVVNLVIYAALVHGFDTPYILAALISNPVAIANNFVWHRVWTFKATDAQKRHQVLRFLLVCAVGFTINIIVLRFGVETVGLSKLVAEVIAAGVAAPVTFVLNRQWAFRGRPQVT
jgi:putative flippase GtrA